jgi:hypothetical protein
VYHDGGRKAAGVRGDAGDCVTRAIAIATGRPYREVYDLINRHGKAERPVQWRRRQARRSSARDGVHKATTRAVMTALGWRWTPTMMIGSGCTVHLREDELPRGRLVVQTSRHLVAVIDGVVYDTEDPTRGGSRCVYGVWAPPEMRRAV